MRPILDTKMMLATAIAEAAKGHANQFDKGGMPYVMHPLTVMHYLKTDDPELMAIAVLHDFVEDCFSAPEEGFTALYNLGMSDRVIAGVRALTKIKGLTPEVYLSGIKTNKDATRVKLCDLRHNMDARRLKGVTEKDRERMDKYCKMYWELKDTV